MREVSIVYIPPPKLSPLLLANYRKQGAGKKSAIVIIAKSVCFMGIFVLGVRVHLFSTTSLKGKQGLHSFHTNGIVTHMTRPTTRTGASL